MRCMICQRKGETKHLPLYIIGSEGLDICHACEMYLVQHIQGLRNLASVSRRLGYKNAKDIAKAKKGVGWEIELYTKKKSTKS